MDVRIAEVGDGSSDHEVLLRTAKDLGQRKYVLEAKPHGLESILLGAFEGASCVGFLRIIVQVIGSEEGRTPIRGRGKAPLKEGFAEAFGVLPDRRRQGIGQRLQERAISICRDRGCYQMRSKSPLSSHENYSLKLKMGYSVHPDTDHDAYFFARLL